MVHVLDFEQFRDKRRSLFISFRLSDLGEFQKLCFSGKNFKKISGAFLFSLSVYTATCTHGVQFGVRLD